MTPPLLAAVVSLLEGAGVSYALIGGAALAVRGIARSTLDFDLFTTDTRVLDFAFWRDLDAAGTHVSVREGEQQDPLAGAVRIDPRDDQRSVDVIVGRDGWQEAVVRRADAIELDDGVIPVARASDLILLKLYAGGTQDEWDITQLLDTGDRRTLVAAVEVDLGALPADARARWRHIAVKQD